MDAATALLLIVGLACLAVLAWAGRRRFPLRIGTGNFFRRKTQVAIVVAGLLIGTAIITSSYVIQSTFDYTVRSAVFRSFDHVDEIIFVAAPDGSRAPFDIRVFDDLWVNRSSMPAVAGLAPRYQLGAAIVDNDSRLFNPTGTVIGFDATYDLGSFVRLDGSQWDGAGLAPGEAIINEKLREAIEAREGDTLLLNVGGPNGPVRFAVSVARVVKDAGRGAWADGENVFVPLASLQVALGAVDQINSVIVENVGGVTAGYLRSDEVVRQVEAFLPADPTFTISKSKADAVDQATRNINQLSQIFTLLGFFTIIAGVLLIINIFVMLAEERKGEMGVARALGMRRANLVQSFVSEGLLYALLSSFVGTFAGLLIAGVILWGFQQIFPPEAFGGVAFVLTWTWADLIQGFALGFLITMGTIGIASWRVSRLNIVRAIRDIPEPVQHRSTRRQMGAGAGLAVLGGFLFATALLSRNVALQDVGPVTLVLGLAILTMRIIPARAPFTAAGAFTIGWTLSPWKFFSIANADISLFIIAGLLLVFGGLLIVMFNSDTVLAIATRLLRRRTWRPVVRTAIAYPMNKKFRTGATLASIALVMFTIATMSGIQAMVNASIQTTSARESGGFELFGTSFVPIPDWEAAFAAYENQSVTRNFSEAHGLPQAPRVRISANATLAGPLHNSSMIGVPAGWTPPFPLQVRQSGFPDDAAAWAELQDNPNVAIVDGSVIPNNFGPNFGTFTASVGDAFYFRNATGVHEVTIIGILYETSNRGLWVSSSALQSYFGIEDASLFYFKAEPGVDVTQAGHDIERYFIAYQLITINILDVINTILEVTMGVFNLLQAYLALGLIVGIAGLGVITMRNVVERRQETGALRALGFRKSMVLKSFLFELSFIALTGIAMGILLGVALSYDIYLGFFEGQAPFVIPWDRLVLLGGIAFLGSVLATASPAIRAARMPPAEALRTFE